jgi:hypothetical protein
MCFLSYYIFDAIKLKFLLLDSLNLGLFSIVINSKFVIKVKNLNHFPILELNL